MSGPNYARLKGPGDFDAPAETEAEPGPIWGDLDEVESVLRDYEFFTDNAAEIMADYLTGERDNFAEQKMLRLMRQLSENCEAHINELDGEF